MDAFPFRFCPACGDRGIQLHRGHEFRCAACGFVYFHNVAAASGVILEHKGKILCMVRGMDPGKGKYGLPGGFVDPGEAAEEALARECREEAALEIADIRFFRSYPNDYEYRGVTYMTCDLFFTAKPAPTCRMDEDGFPLVQGDPDETLRLCWIGVAELDPEEFAFGSLKRALREYIASRAARP
jgi:ADP-ribose pyrophosphatase YjhB (NUDIX family)